jgi:hypothetical protein
LFTLQSRQAAALPSATWRFYRIINLRPTIFVTRRKRSRNSFRAGETPDGSRAPQNRSEHLSDDSKKSATGSARTKLRLSQAADGTWQFVQPRCALARQEDIQEVEQMIAAEETEIAQDELRWLLSECHDFMAAHKLLGDLAVIEKDYRLARGHYGYAYQIGLKAIDSAGSALKLPYRHASNQAFFQAGKGVITCLLKLNKQRMAKDVIARLLQLDAGDPLGLRSLSKR